LTISRRRSERASGAARLALALGLAAGAGACRGSTPGIEGPAPGPTPRSYSADQVFTVEVWGAQAPDTVVTFPASRARSIVLRHGLPDNTVFAEVDIPANALVPPGGGDQVTLTIRPLPGVYGLALESEASVTAPIRLTFKYPVHFAAPSDSRARYPTDVLFEQALVVALAEDGGTKFQTLRSTRPASDNLQAMVSTLGQYQMVAPR
jgi:hypothetical protein